MAGMLPEIDALITCLEVGQFTRYSLHDVFRSIAFLPETMAVYVEWRHEEPFRFRLRLQAHAQDLEFETEDFEVLAHASGRSESVVELPLKLAGLLPGGYNLVVVTEDGTELHRRIVFFGEM